MTTRLVMSEFIFFSQGNPFPHTINNNAGSAQLKRTFVIVGGYNSTVWADDSTLDTLYRYNPNEDSWTLLPSRLTVPRHDVSAFPVRMDAFKECN